MEFSNQYWDELYSSDKTGWDMGSVSIPLKEYFDQLTNNEIKILVPGAGKAWEVEYLYLAGFKNVYVLDYSIVAINEFKLRCPWFPDSHILNEDFFVHQGKYDLIVEQTFFSSLHPVQRSRYAQNIYDKLVAEGKLVGLLFNHEFDFSGPPWGGSRMEYIQLFNNYFKIEIMEIAHNSIKPRLGRELFMLLKKVNPSETNE